MTNRLLLLFALLAVCACRSEQSLVVFDLQTDKLALEEAARGQLADHLAARLGECGKVRILPRAPLAGACPGLEPACLRQKADSLQASGFVTARVLRPGERCSLALAVYETEGQAAIRSSSAQSGCTADELLTAIDLAVGRLGPPWPAADESALAGQELQAQIERLNAEIRRLEQLAERQAEPSPPPAGTSAPAEPAPGEPEPDADSIRARLTGEPVEAGQALPDAAGRLEVRPQLTRPGAVTEQDEAGQALPAEPDGAEPDGPRPGLDRAVIMRIIRQHTGRIRACVRPGGEPLQRRRLLIHFSIQPSGRVSGLEIEPRDQAAGPEHKCVANVFRRLRFPAHGGPPKKVTIPIAIQ
ncbi:MAG: hypothetical protein JXR96_23000 [Deltaproteobacteria bacterium]|nr:hypothetical protein [Deltaproteobacteria bacterium]